MTTGSHGADPAPIEEDGFARLGGEPEPIRAAGMVVDEDRGSLPYALIHGEALVAAAAWAAGEAGIDLVDQTVPWLAVGDLDLPLVLHDPLCPMTPPGFLASCVRAAVARNVVVVAGGPEEGTVCSPVVLPPHVVGDLDGLPTSDFAALVRWLRERHPVEVIEAPPFARRVASEDDLRVLEALTDPR